MSNKIQSVQIAEVTDEIEERPPAFSDEALALRFAERHQNDLRYVSAWGKWVSWTGTYWRFDDTLHAFDLARRICREAAAECNKARMQTVIANARTVAAVERLAKADRRIAATTDQWDTDPWVLNTPGGIVDLRTGKCRPCDPTDYQTKVTAVAVGDAACCTMWRAFLHRITGGDEELEQYLQRVVGYVLTGLTTELALFFLYGTGQNGKSVFVNVIGTILAEYRRAAPIETFTESKTDRHPTELARLRGARIVTVAETEKGRRWAESRIKQLTGGDPVAAHFMRQDDFEFIPQFKLIIFGNYKPGLRAVNEAMRARFNMIPFTVTIPKEERDKELVTRLIRDEGPAILAWMVEGCLKWQEHGLNPPNAVTDATAAYLEGEDATSTWIEECCEKDSNAWTETMTLFKSWRTWAEAAQEFVGSSKQFNEALENHRLRHQKRHGNRGHWGVRLRPHPTITRAVNEGELPF